MNRVFKCCRCCSGCTKKHNFPCPSHQKWKDGTDE